MRIKKLVLLISCLAASGAALAQDSNQGGAQGGAPESVAENANLPPVLAKSVDTVTPTSVGPGGAPCTDPVSCLGISEADLKSEAQLKPEIQIKEAPVVVTPEPTVSDPAKLAVRQSQEWAENPHAYPAQGKDGRMVFTFGDSAPTIICAPLRVCDIELEPGETIQGAPHIGDSVRWKIAPAVSAEGDQRITHLIIKPTEPGLDTNLMVPTDRRTYHLRLVSSRDKYLARVAFEYPDNTNQIWQKMMAKPVKNERSSQSPASQSDFPNVAVERINFDYKVEVVKGKPKFKPLRVMDDGARTYISMNDNVPVEEAPVLILIDPDGSEQMVNYRLKGNIYTIDRMTDRFALISGTGVGQQRIEVTREKKCAKHGWFGRCLDGSE
jgi:type IV secretion system protein TrbG